MQRAPLPNLDPMQMGGEGNFLFENIEFMSANHKKIQNVTLVDVTKKLLIYILLQFIFIQRCNLFACIFLYFCIIVQ